MKRSLIFVLILLLISNCYSQKQSALYSKTGQCKGMTSFQLRSYNIEDDFVIDVSLPASYDEKPNVKYPVLYLTDGYWRREQHAPIHFLSGTENVSEMVIVGIGYPETYDFNKIRVRDLIKRPDRFLSFILDELIPVIEERYRTNNELTLWGSSFGGYFALYTLFQSDRKSKDKFRNYIIVSPPPNELSDINGESLNLWEFEKRFHSRTNALPVNIYLAVGGDEGKERFLNPFKELIRLLENRKYLGLNLIWFIDPGKDHFTVWEPAMFEGIRLLLKK